MKCRALQDVCTPRTLVEFISHFYGLMAEEARWLPTVSGHVRRETTGVRRQIQRNMQCADGHRLYTVELKCRWPLV
jgi:hypothetical protein